MNMDTNKINDLAKILRQNQLTKLDLTEGDTRIVLEAGGRQAVVEMPVVSVENIAEVPVAEVPSVEKAEAPAGVEQKSPLVGTVYLAPQAGAEPFVQVGDKVKKGDVLCIVESMKMFNNIEAELEGTIAAVCVDNGQIVEFGHGFCHCRGNAVVFLLCRLCCFAVRADFKGDIRCIGVCLHHTCTVYVDFAFSRIRHARRPDG